MKTIPIKITIMKDLLGNEIKTDDILLELGRGWGSLFGSEYKYHMKIWQKPSDNDGSGYEYNIDGTKYKYWWASVKNSIKIDMSIMPEEFEYSFYHGMSEIASKIEKGTLLEIIENSDWKNYVVKKEEVERFHFLKTIKIETLEDIKNNINELKKGGYVPKEIIYKVLDITGVGRTEVHNGEIGIAAMYDQAYYQDIIEVLSRKQ
jgi:hypothetical protein